MLFTVSEVPSHDHLVPLLWDDGEEHIMAECVTNQTFYIINLKEKIRKRGLGSHSKEQVPNDSMISQTFMRKDVLMLPYCNLLIRSYHLFPQLKMCWGVQLPVYILLVMLMHHCGRVHICHEDHMAYNTKTIYYMTLYRKGLSCKTPTFEL